MAINVPDQLHQLRLNASGSKVSALQVACILYVGIELLLSGKDAGIDLAAGVKPAEGIRGKILLVNPLAEPSWQSRGLITQELGSPLAGGWPRDGLVDADQSVKRDSCRG